MVSTVTIPGSERQFTFKGLLQRQHYEFWLVAHTIIGEGARSKVTSSSPMDEGFSLKTCSEESSDQVFYLFSPCKDYQLFLRHLLSTKPEHIPALSHGGKSSSTPILGSQQQAGHQRGPVPGPQRWHPGREGHPREYEWSCVPSWELVRQGPDQLLYYCGKVSNCSNNKCEQDHNIFYHSHMESSLQWWSSSSR